MKIKTTLVLLMSSLLLASVACNVADKIDGKEKSNKVDTNEIRNNQKITDQERSKLLTDAAEDLIQKDGALYAVAILDEAINIDANNTRAQLYRHILDIGLAGKGIFTRAAPLAQKNARIESDINTKQQYDMTDHLRKALFESDTKDVASEEDAQRLIDEVQKRVKNLRDFIKANKDKEITVTRLKDRSKVKKYDIEYTCTVIEKDPGVFYAVDADVITKNNFESEKSDVITKATFESSTAVEKEDVCAFEYIEKPNRFKMVRAEWEYLQQVVSGLEMSIYLTNRYSGLGVLEKANALGVLTSKDLSLISNQSKYDVIKNISTAGLLRNTNLNSFETIGVDAVGATKWAIKFQGDICQDRRGYGFRDGLCVKNVESVNREISKVEAGVAGEAVEINNLNLGWDDMRGEEVRYDTVLNASKFFNNPHSDLRQLNPVWGDMYKGNYYSECDKIEAIADASVNGALPNADANQIIMLNTKAQCK